MPRPGLGTKGNYHTEMSLGKSQLLLLVQPRVFATTNHFREMVPSPTVRALDEALGPEAKAVPSP